MNQPDFEGEAHAAAREIVERSEYQVPASTTGAASVIEDAIALGFLKGVRFYQERVTEMIEGERRDADPT